MAYQLGQGREGRGLRLAAALVVASLAAVLLLAAQTQDGAVELAFSPHPPSTVPHQSVDQAWADLAAHAPAAPSWLAAAEAKQPSAVAAVDAAHARDPNFPVESPSVARAKEVDAREPKAARASLPSAPPAPKEYRSSNAEWQNLRKSMYKAVHVFHKYGDLALEKLVPHRAPELHASTQTQTLRAQQQSHPATAGEREAGAAQEEAGLKLGALRAEETAKIDAANQKEKALARELAQAQAQDKRRMAHIQKEVEGLQAENQRLRKRGAKRDEQLRRAAKEAKEAAEAAAKGKEAQLEKQVAAAKRRGEAAVSKLEAREGEMAEANAGLRAEVEAAHQQLAHQQQQQEHQQHQPQALRRLARKDHHQQQQQPQRQQQQAPRALGDDVVRDAAAEMMGEHHHTPALAPSALPNHPHPRPAPPAVAAVHPLSRHPIRGAPAAGRGGAGSAGFNAHLPEAGFAFTDSSLGCVSCISGPDCHAGCRIVPGKPDGITMAEVNLHRRQQRLRALSGHMLKGEEAGEAAKEGGEEEETGSKCEEEDGGCSKLEEEGVNVDGWGDEAEAAAGEGAKDPAVNVAARREMNEREGRFAAYDHSKDEGVYTPPSSWGAAARFFGRDGSPGAEKLREHKVAVDRWPSDIYSSVPLPMFDKSVWDHQKNSGLVMHDALKFNRESNAPMEHAGVLVNKWPSEEFEGEREMPTMDGMPDHYVENKPLPQYRGTGQAPQEKPLYFLLRDHPNMAAAQPHVDPKKGVETWDEHSMEGHKPGEPGWRSIHDSLGCGPQGCFDK